MKKRKAPRKCILQWEETYLFRLVGIRKRSDHPYDIKVSESSISGEGAGQYCCLASGNLNTPWTDRHLQRTHHACKEKMTQFKHFRRRNLNLNISVGPMYIQVTTAAFCCYIAVPYQLLQARELYSSPNRSGCSHADIFQRQMQLGVPFK